MNREKDESLTKAGLEESVDVVGDEGRLESLGVSLDRLAVGVDQKLLEVPGDVAPLHRTPDDELGVGHQAEKEKNIFFIITNSLSF